MLAHEYLVAFTHGSERDLAQVRASAALWASSEVIDAMAERNRLVAKLPPKDPQTNAYRIPASSRGEIQINTGRIIAGMRADLGASQMSSREVAEMLFDDFTAEGTTSGFDF